MPTACISGHVNTNQSGSGTTICGESDRLLIVPLSCQVQRQHDQLAGLR